MKTFNYFETIAIFHQGIWGQLRQGISLEQSIAISFDSMWLYPEEEHVLNNMVILIELINVELGIHKKMRKQASDLYQKLQKQIKVIDLKLLMSEYEIEAFEESIEVLDSDLLDYPIITAN